jgi:hypothetical protein
MRIGTSRATIRGMESNRFDDVEIRIVEEPVEPRTPRRTWRAGPAMLAVTAALALTGSLAAGASALTSTAEAPTHSIEQSTGVIDYHGWDSQRDGTCRKDDDRRRSSSTPVDY